MLLIDGISLGDPIAQIPVTNIKTKTIQIPVFNDGTIDKMKVVGPKYFLHQRRMTIHSMYAEVVSQLKKVVIEIVRIAQDYPATKAENSDGDAFQPGVY